MQVNEDAKHIIHKFLLETENWISGEKLSAILGISRVAVWKHLQKMKDSGYPLLSSGKGYKLDPHEDSLSPWAFDNRKRRIHYFRVTDSTMVEARVLAEKRTSGGALVLAEEQTSGKGRMGRKWKSDKGGLYFTIIEYPEGPLNMVNIINKTAVLSVQETLNLDFGIEAWCMEPGDIWTKAGKIGGVLLEISGEIERIRYVNTGIGINIRDDRVSESGLSDENPDYLNKYEPRAVLEEILEKEIKRREVLEKFLIRYESNQKLKYPEILKKWNRSLKIQSEKIDTRKNI